MQILSTGPLFMHGVVPIKQQMTINEVQSKRLKTHSTFSIHLVFNPSNSNVSATMITPTDFGDAILHSFTIIMTIHVLAIASVTLSHFKPCDVLRKRVICFLNFIN